MYKLDSLEINWSISEEFYFTGYNSFSISITKGCYLFVFMHASGGTHFSYLAINNTYYPLLIPFYIESVFDVEITTSSIIFKYKGGVGSHTTGRIRYIKF